jgi:very-short-patch-repair endonuclease
MCVSESGIKRWVTRRERYGISGIKNLSDFKKKQSILAEKRWENQKYVEKMKIIHNSDSYKHNVSESAKTAYKNNPNLKQIHSDIINNPETTEKKIKNNKSLNGRKKNSVGMKLRWTDVDYRKKVTIACKEACKKPEVMGRKIKAIGKQRKYNTIPEQILESIVRSFGYDYFSQYPIENISCVDGFVEPNYVFYADGRYWHGSKFPKTQEKDKRQTEALTNLGYVVLRFSEYDLKNNPEEVKKTIINVFDINRSAKNQ